VADAHVACIKLHMYELHTVMSGAVMHTDTVVPYYAAMARGRATVDDVLACSVALSHMILGCAFGLTSTSTDCLAVASGSAGGCRCIALTARTSESCPPIEWFDKEAVGMQTTCNSL
jgi:hypothetical protein